MKKATSASMVSRRAFLAAIGLASATALLAACGESKPEPGVVSSGAAGTEVEAAIERASSATADQPERSPQPDGRVPAPGALRRVGIAMRPSSRLGGNFMALAINGLDTATRLSDRRYDFDEIALDTRIDSQVTFSMSALLDTAIGEEPELAGFFGSDIHDLIDHERLLPLDDFLAADAEFDPAGYWPGALKSLQRDGVTYGLPAMVSPFVMVLNQDVANALNFEPPEPSRTAFDRETYLATAQAMQRDAPPGGGLETIGILTQYYSEPRSTGDYVNSPPLTFMLASALGALRDEGGSFAPLVSDRAAETVEFARDWVRVHRLAVTERRDIGLYARDRKIGMWPADLGFLSPGDLPQGVTRVYPFPDMGSGANPCSVLVGIGVLSGSKEPNVVYDAMRWLDQGLAESASIPARRVSPERMKENLAELSIAEAELVVDLLEHGVYTGVSRRDAAIINNTLMREVIWGDLSPEQGLRNVVQELEALRTGD